MSKTTEIPASIMYFPNSGLDRSHDLGNEKTIKFLDVDCQYFPYGHNQKTTNNKSQSHCNNYPQVDKVADSKIRHRKIKFSRNRGQASITSKPKDNLRHRSQGVSSSQIQSRSISRSRNKSSYKEIMAEWSNFMATQQKSLKKPKKSHRRSMVGQN